MQYPTIHAPRTIDTPPAPRRLAYLAAAVVAATALYGLGTHHVLLVAAGLVAVLLFQHRLRLLADPPAHGPVVGQPHTDGGSFRAPARRITPSTHPSVIDGGTSRRTSGDAPHRQRGA